MMIEKFITYVARKKNVSYLQFSPSATLSVPQKVNDSPTLLYVHIPFCEELCPYCSFNRVVFREDLARSYFEALRKEILMYRDRGYDFQGLYVGGGTPTVLVDELVLTLQLIRQTYHVTEISVETNPNHLTDRNLRLLKDAGVNRLSVGVQTFDDNLLKIVERYHKYGSGQEISERLRSTQGIFDTLNVDMIFNFPTQTLEILEKDLATLVAIKADQVTYYPLMVSSSTQDVMSRKLGVVDYNRGGTYYSKIVRMLSREYRPTTAWCFSRTAAPIDEYVVNYDEYAGLGSGSIGYLGGSAYSNTFDIRDYISRINRGVLPITAKRDFSLQERLRYDFLMKLFGLELDLAHLSAKHDTGAYGHLWPEITFFRLIGGLSKKGKVLRLTETGQYYWVLMMREFFIGVNNFRDYCRAELPKEPATFRK
ncbi:MAG: Oxygen-independent coproporphyrinogen-III oxidase 1 [Syntrophorhabdus sp. PtaU1.Bin153]|nr:MAG: Oxygen-independent coproporphyrinogen-III oxidase 1 [Syntrophorhabdus sp. PtaU1.Bin153]